MRTLGKMTIYENLREVVNPEHTALVIWDLHKAWVDRIFNKEEFLEEQ